MTRQTLDRPTPPVSTGGARDVRPVMLLTLDVPFDREAVDFAVESALETGAELLLCEAIPLLAGNPAAQAARSFAELEAKRELDAVAREARALGVRATELVFHNPRPVSAALEVTRELRVGLLVFGADRRRLGRWSFRRAARRLRERASCLVWTNE